VVGDAALEASVDDGLSVPNLGGAKVWPTTSSTPAVGLLERMDRDFAGARTQRGDRRRTARLRPRPAASCVPRRPACSTWPASPAKRRDNYGRTQFGQGCLLARRLVEAGVPVRGGRLEVGIHINQNFERVGSPGADLDAGWSALMDDLTERGLLDSNVDRVDGRVVPATPVINAGAGRDQLPPCLSGRAGGRAGIRGGQAVGRTSKDGLAVEERPTTAPDLIAHGIPRAGPSIRASRTHPT